MTDPTPDPAPQDSPADKGYPENTSPAQMNDAQRAAFYEQQAKKADNLRKTLSAFNGFTPEDVSAMWTRLEELETEKLGATEKAAREAATKAAAEAKSAASAELLPKVLQAQLKAAAGAVLREKEQLKSFLDFADPSKFVGESGDIDDEKVIGHLTALYGGQQPPDRQWGQHGGTPPATNPGAGGRAEAERRAKQRQPG